MKGIILAGGNGTRLFPLTKVTNKHLLPVYNDLMITYPLRTLINNGIKDILIVSGRGHCGQFLELLSDGSEFGVNLNYMVQEKPAGIAHALGLAKRFVGKENFASILGDNIFDTREKFDFTNFREGGRVYLKAVHNAARFGCAHLDERGHLIEIVEKPKECISNLAVTGLYLYDSSVFDIISCLKPSERNELEITDVNNEYISRKQLEYKIIDGFWSDAGTQESLYNASTFVRSQIDSNNIINNISSKGDV